MRSPDRRLPHIRNGLAYRTFLIRSSIVDKPRWTNLRRLLIEKGLYLFLPAESPLVCGICTHLQ